MTALMTKELSLHSKNLTKAFRALDYNKDGTVDTEELHKGLEQIN